MTAKREATAVVEMLLHEANIGVNDQDCAGRTSLYTAVDLGQEVNARLLLDNGANPDPLGEDAPPLHVAGFNGNEVLVLLLLEKRADSRTRNWEYGF